jgi:hypothetical protein
MLPIQVLLATDEVSIIPDYAKQLFESQEWFGDDPAPVTRGLAGELSVRGFQVGFTKLDELAESLEMRATLGCVYHVLCVLTIRVWKVGRALRTAIEAVRSLPDEAVLSNGLRLKTLPVVIANPANLLGNMKKYDVDWDWIANARWVGAQQGEEAVPETLIRSLADWQAELVTELEYAGCGINIGERGSIEVFPYFERHSLEGTFFGPRATIAGLRETGFIRMPKEAVAIADSLYALEQALNEVRALPPKEQEPRLQKCLEEHSVLITQGMFKTPWPRRTLRHPDPLQKDIQPDFVMTPHADWEAVLRPRVLEIKTSEKMAVRGRQLTKDLLDALEQLMGRYARFFADERTREEQARVYGRSLEQPNYALLIDRRLSPESRQTWEEKRGQSAWKGVSLVTYNDLLDFAAQRVSLVDKVQLRLQQKLVGDD